MIFRSSVTGNKTYDAVENAAYITYQNRLDHNIVQGQIDAAEVAYLYTCWLSAITQLGPIDFGSNFSGYSLAGHNVVIPLNCIVKNLTTALRTRGFTSLPTSFQVAIAAVVTEATEGATNLVGDILTVTGGASNPLVAAKMIITGLGATGSVETVSMLNMGLYTTVPANDVATTTNGGGDNNATFTMTYATLPTEFNF